ncbi:MAG: colicin E3/pyocin S6 family cytotoxin [Planctomycetaceae bacterium]
MDYLGFVHGDQCWRSEDGKRLFTWDSLHGEVEVSNRRGKRVFVADAVSGRLIGQPVHGRKIDV